MKAKKSYGQHFLAQPQIARQIAYSIDYDGVDQVIEVGPGQGMLTQFLRMRELPVYAVEADRDMVAHLKEADAAWVEEFVTEEDFLKVDLEELTRKRQTALVGNFPYNISSQILIRLVENRAYFPRLVGMFQKELAERVLAPPGSKTYGVISVLVQAYYSGKMVLQVKPGSFNPPPKVNSSVIALERLPGNGPNCDPEKFRTVVRTAFQQRRKMLRNSLKPLWPVDMDPEDKSLMRRPEQLSIADFVEIVDRIESGKG
ncbi:MAG: 16S rRNA (adenine(1518)-N(6)/adenine(1519)-N(6))-dimethyltransferase RsmA [Saprospiraceae bacterium]